MIEMENSILDIYDKRDELIECAFKLDIKWVTDLFVEYCNSRNIAHALHQNKWNNTIGKMEN